MSTRVIKQVGKIQLFEHVGAGYYAFFNTETQEPSIAFGTDSRDEFLELSDSDFELQGQELIDS